MTQNPTNKAWRDRNKAYLREYRRAWRARFKETHGMSYETYRRLKKAGENV